MPELISSASNPLVKQIRSLRQKKGRQETGFFLVEGIHHVGEVVAAGWEIETLVYAPDLLKSDFGLHLVEARLHDGLRVSMVTSALFSVLAEKENPQGILAIVHQRHKTLEQFVPERFSLGAAVVSPQDPGNVGTILRTLDAVGADGLFLLEGGVELFHPSTVRASMGTIFWIPVVETSFDGFIKWVRENRFYLVGTSAHATVDYCDLQSKKVSTILLFGSEKKGLSPEQLSACDINISLPMRGRASSLNLAVASGILLYFVGGQKRGARIAPQNNDRSGTTLG